MFTIITVAVNQVHFGVPLAITVALVIATIKGSMVASVFMHLSHEKKWIYGALILTVVGFLVLMAFRVHDDGPHRHADSRRGAGRAARGALMSLRMFHLVFIALSVMLAAFFAAWAGAQYQAGHDCRLRGERRPVAGGRRRAGRLRRGVPAEDQAAVEDAYR